VGVLEGAPEKVSDFANEETESPLILRDQVVRPGMTPALRQQLDQRPERVERENVETKTPDVTKPQLKIPVTSLRTPQALVLQRLLIYDRENVFMPIVASGTQQSLNQGKGRISDFDYQRINEDLREQLLATCAPLALHVFQFQYAGEIRKSGGLRGLATRMKQTPLSVATLDEIWKELDTQNRLTRLLALLEGCITFLVASGGSAQQYEGDVLLEDYILDTLLINPQKWDEIRCPSLAQHVRLSHLQCLYLDLEMRNGNDPLANVALSYRDEISSELSSHLYQVLSKIDTTIFNPILREFCTEQLSAGTWPSSSNLKEYLGYSTEVDLETFEWFALIPDELELRHSYELYKVLSRPLL